MKQDPVYAEFSHSTDGPGLPPPAEHEPVNYATLVRTVSAPASFPPKCITQVYIIIILVKLEPRL